MIYDHISRLSLYRGISENLDIAIEFLSDLSTKSIKKGRNEIEGENVYANCFELITSPYEEGNLFEAHRRYIDLHLPLCGKERIYFADAQKLTIEKAYDETGECAMLTGKSDGFCELDEEHFCITFPKDAHLPGKSIDTDEPILKMVVKVKE